MAELRRLENGRGASAIGAGGSSRVVAILWGNKGIIKWESASGFSVLSLGS